MYYSIIIVTNVRKEKKKIVGMIYLGKFDLVTSMRG